ncbi:MAG: response regulator [Planctomycetes bacterium]|nr:response regulator [Planctomycetota bacterium]
MTESRTILLVEDNEKDIHLARAAFEAAGGDACLVVARDGEEAIEYLTYRGKFHLRNRQDPAVVLLDIKMPRMSGLEVLRRMRQEDALRFLPVVFLTSSRDPNDLSTGYRLGANGYVVKPSQFQAFKQAVREISTFWTRFNEVPAANQGGQAPGASDDSNITPRPRQISESGF